MEYNPLSAQRIVLPELDTTPVQATVALFPIFQEIFSLPKAFPSSHLVSAASSPHTVFLSFMIAVFFLFHAPCFPSDG